MNEQSFALFNRAITFGGDLINSAALSFFVSKLLPDKSRNIKTALIFVGYLGILLLTDLTGAPAGVSSAALIGAAAAAAPLFKISRSTCALYALLFLNTRVQSGIISQSIYYAIEKAYPYPDAPLEAVFEHSSMLVTTYMVCFSALFIAMLVLLNRRLRKHSLGDYGSGSLYLCLYPAAGVIFGAVISRILIEPSQGELLILFNRHPAFQGVFPILAAMFYLGAYIMIASEQKLANSKLEQARLTVEAQMTDELKNRVQELNAGYERIRAVKHDIRNHLNTLNSLIAAGHCEQAQKYIQNIARDIETRNDGLATGNPVTDAVLNELSDKCKNAGIEFESDFIFNGETRIEAFDIAVILSNLLTNAYEACLKTEKKPRFIRLKSGKKGRFYIIEIDNSSPYTEIGSNGQIRTTKPYDGSLHGIGLKSIDAKVRKYTGETSYIYENGVFHAAIVLQEKEDSEAAETDN